MRAQLVSCLLVLGSSLAGCAFAPQPPSVDFGEVIVGQTSNPQQVTWLHDDPKWAGNADDIDTSGSSAFSYAPFATPLARGVPVGASTPPVSFTFQPPAVGRFDGKAWPYQFWFGLSPAPSGLEVSLTGTGVLQVVPGGGYVRPGPGYALGTPGAAPGTAVAVPWRGAIDFGTVILPGAGSWRTLTLSNPDSTDRTLDIVFVSFSGAWSAEMTATASSTISNVKVPAGGAITVILYFHPTAPGPDAATVTFQTRNGMPHIVLDLSGKAVGG